MASLTDPQYELESNPEPYILITGGAGFVGANLADAYLRQGQRVLLLDNLSRPGVEKNLAWLKNRHGDALELQCSDIRNYHHVKKAVANAQTVLHLAAQVAVTTSLHDPVTDFEVNSRGTLNLLEALRELDRPVPFIFTSTNKVYGELDDLRLQEQNTRYVPSNLEVAQTGIGEDRNIRFQSPYGCSKGAADQYVLDYAGSYGLQAVVFRMSCIYGPLQCGTEDQGWVAHFIKSILAGKRITIYGDGKQVRDILFVDDLVSAFQYALANIDRLAGRVFNIGGGPRNSISLLELIDMLEDLHAQKIDCRFDGWRTGDQRYYVSNIGKFAQATGWRPTVDATEGVERLYWWMQTSQDRVASTQPVFAKAGNGDHKSNGDGRANGKYAVRQRIVTSVRNGGSTLAEVGSE